MAVTMMAAKVAVVSEAREGEQGVSKAGSVCCLESRLDELHNVLQAVSGNRTHSQRDRDILHPMGLSTARVSRLCAIENYFGDREAVCFPAI